jgi:hypothetical protein
MRSARGFLAFILLVSLGLRLFLAAQGGQDYWPDEARFQGSQYAVQHAVAGNWSEVGRWLFGQADHSLFRWIGLPAALAESIFGRSSFLISSYFSLFSVLAIYLVWRVARQAGAGEREALLAAFLASCASSLLYFSRHSFPYDSALCIFLFALERGLRGDRARHSLEVGALAGCGFLTYNGYWLLGASVLAVHVLATPLSLAGALRRAAWALLGLGAVVLGFLVSARCLGYNLLADLRENAGTITQGDFGTAYWVIPEYLWHAEGVFAVAGVVGLAVGCGQILRGAAPNRLASWILAVFVITGGLVVLSDVAPVFVVYGRLVRMLIPFTCLICACVIHRWAERQVLAIPRVRWVWGTLACVALALVNFAGPLTQRFPADFQIAAREEATRLQAADGSAYRTVGTYHLWGVEVGRALPAHQVILRTRHPLQFKPYQYEGFSRAQRLEFREHDITMRLIRLPVRLPAPDGPDSPAAGPLRLRLRFPSELPGVTEPLITTGRPGAGDMIFVNYVDERTLRIGVDSWGRGGAISDPLEVDYGKEHDVVLSLESFLPAADGEPTAERLIADGLRGRVVVALDGREVLTFRGAQHPSTRAEISLGANRIGMTSAKTEFSGEIKAVAYATRAEVMALKPSIAERLAGRDPEWSGYSGPVTFTLRLPERFPASGLAEPLLTSGVTGAGDFLNVVYQGDAAIQIGYDRWGYGAFVSEVFPVQAGQELTVHLSAGFLFPPDWSPSAGDPASLAALHGRVVVVVDGRIVLDREAASHLARSDQVTVGVNRIGGSTASERFSGDIIAVRSWDGVVNP